MMTDPKLPRYTTDPGADTAEKRDHEKFMKIVMASDKALKKDGKP